MSLEQPKRLSLKKNMVWITLGGAADLLCQWGLIAVISRLMNVEAVGLYGLAMVVVAPLLAFANLGLREAQATDARHEYTFGHYLTLRTFTNVVALIVIAIVASAMRLEAVGMMVVMLFGLARVIDAQSNAYHGLFQQCERMDFLAQSNLVRSMSSLIFFTVALMLTGDLRAGCLGMVASCLLTLVFYDMPRARQLHGYPGSTGPASATRLIWETKPLVRLATHALPLGFVAVLSALQVNIPRFVIEDSLGLAALGYFTAVVALYMAATRMATFLGQAASSRLAQRFSSGAMPEYGKLLVQMGGLGLAGGIVGIFIVYFWGREVLTLLYTPEYGDYSDILLLVMVAALFRQVAMMLQFGTIAARRFRLHLVQNVLIIILITVASFVLIGPYGLWGAAVVLVIAGIADAAIVAVMAIFIMRDHSLKSAGDQTVSPKLR